MARRLTAPGLDRDPESFAPPGLDRELNESSSTKGTASDLGISELQNSVTASGRTIPVEDARSVNRHSQTRSGGAGERFSPAESSSRLYLTLKQQQQQHTINISNRPNQKILIPDWLITSHVA